MRLPSVLGFTQDLIGQALTEGDVAIDATVGNGHDTLYLARCVGASGMVFGFDIQEAALEAARSRILEAGLEAQTRLILASHDTMADWLESYVPGRRVRAVMFNLGYRPGGDRSKITRPETTLPALDTALQLLSSGGLLTIVLYPGHPGGLVESEAVQEWVQSQILHCSSVLRYEFLNPKSPPPILLALVTQNDRSANLFD
ncbi:class I SAM-dependent methyltransferase [soil metagenome]